MLPSPAAKGAVKVKPAVSKKISTPVSGCHVKNIKYRVVFFLKTLTAPPRTTTDELSFFCFSFSEKILKRSLRSIKNTSQF